ncbi:MAG: lytic transglycosylase domain-containing protein [Devosiaceae bacterium]|nr:lytic transglycosylase domain-containing protein [Devosiaceae bacterium MH13]
MSASSPNDRIESAFASASEATGLPFDYFMTTAMRESSLDTQAAAPTSSARGLFQFIEQTWLGMVHSYGDALGLDEEAAQIERRADGRYSVSDPDAREDVLDLRYDPDLSAMMSGLYLQENATALERALGREVTVGEGYVAHVFGPGNGARLIGLAEGQPNTVAAEIFPTQADANRGLFYTRGGDPVSVRDLYDRLVSGYPDEAVETGGVPVLAAASAGNMPSASSRSASAADSNLPLDLTPAGFDALRTSDAVVPPDALATRGLFTAPDGANVPFFAGLYNPGGLAPTEISDDLLATSSVPPQAVPNPMARPEMGAIAALGGEGSDVGMPLDLTAFSRTGNLGSLYQNHAAQPVSQDLVPPV